MACIKTFITCLCRRIFPQRWFKRFGSERNLPVRMVSDTSLYRDPSMCPYVLAMGSRLAWVLHQPGWCCFCFYYHSTSSAVVVANPDLKKEQAVTITSMLGGWWVSSFLVATTYLTFLTRLTLGRKGYKVFQRGSQAQQSSSIGWLYVMLNCWTSWQCLQN